jgi:hypothetical protein
MKRSKGSRRRPGTRTGTEPRPNTAPDETGCDLVRSFLAERRPGWSLHVNAASVELVTPKGRSLRFDSPWLVLDEIELGAL